MTNTVQIPKGYFFKQSKQEYADYQSRLIAELIQNSYDAGATEIHLDFTNEGYSCKDNGKGMDRETMVGALLTFGGTKKEEGNSGGFGFAKQILLFAQDSYTILSRDTFAEGQCLNYSLADAVYVKGTHITGKYPEGWDACAYNMNYYAERFLKKCHLAAKVYLNGVEFKDWKVAGRCCRDNEWSKLHTKKVSYENCYLFVRKNGLFMFEKYIGESVKKDIILEITAPSTEILTSNRDGFRAEKSQEFDKLFAEIVSDKKSFDRNKTRKWTFKGIKSFISASYEKLKEIEYDRPEVYSLMRHVEKLVEEKNVGELNNIVRNFAFPSAEVGGERVIEIVNRAIQHVEQQIKFDFIVDLGDSGLDSIPKRLHPQTMAESNKAIAKLWRAAIDTVLEANNMSASYRIGFTLNSDSDAQYCRVDGVEELLINPDAKFWGEDKWSKINELIFCAAHEISHRQFSSHHERFILLEERLLIKTLTFIKGDTNFVTKRAKTIDIF